MTNVRIRLTSSSRIQPTSEVVTLLGTAQCPSHAAFNVTDTEKDRSEACRSSARRDGKKFFTITSYSNNA